MKEKVLEVLNQNDALSMEEIADFIGVTSVTSLQELIKVLNELEKEYIVYHSNKDKYLLMEKSHLKKGILRANRKGFGFVEVEGE